MRKITLFSILIFSLFFTTASATKWSSENIDIEMLLMRKASSVKIVLFSKGQDIPKYIEIERKSTAPLSKYRKVLTLTTEQLNIFSETKKLILTDKYPESRQLDSYYRLVITTKEGSLKTPPAIFLPKSKDGESVTFGEQDQKDQILFETEEEKEFFTYKQFDMNFNVRREGTKVLITISGGKTLEGQWFLQKKSSKPLATFRRFKTISQEDMKSTKNGEHVFVDKYPESIQLDTYYRLMVLNKEGEELILPSILLYKASSGR